MKEFDMLLRITEKYVIENFSIGGLRVDRERKYIGIEQNGSDEIETEVFFDDKKNVANILTFHIPPANEKQLGKEYLKNGIDFFVNVRERPYLPNGGIFNGLFPRSPSGKSDDDFMIYLLKKRQLITDRSL